MVVTRRLCEISAGDMVEVAWKGKGFEGSWAEADVVRVEGTKHALVRFREFVDTDGTPLVEKTPNERLRLQRIVVSASRRAFELSERQLRAGTVDIVTVLNTQLTLFQAEDSLAQFQLARLLAVVSLYQALGGGWSPKTTEGPADAL